ncbi:MAG: DUF86 domain-containing protein [Bryobacterales bacterium]|nr:DUF86 domain-containing protein [Bryobacterales bacterium]
MNEDYLAEQFELIEEYVRRARSIAARGEATFLQDPILIDAATRELTVLFETAHNIAKHILSSRDWQKAESKAAAFEILERHGVIEAGMSQAMRQAARFRNLATYQTTMINERTVFEILSRDVGDFEEFVGQVAHWIRASQTDTPSSNSV